MGSNSRYPKYPFYPKYLAPSIQSPGRALGNSDTAHGPRAHDPVSKLRNLATLAIPVQRRLWAAALSSLSSGGRRLALSLSPLSSARSKTISPCLRSPAQGARQAASKTVAEGAVRRAGAGDGDGDSGSPIVVTDARQEVTVSQFVAQLDEAARRRLNSMHQATTEQPDLNKPKL